jgi:glycosyltransferase involved in cell wall biosynthesis
MKIGIISDHNFPIPYKTHTGQICILDLANALKSLGNEVHLFAPSGTDFDNLHPMQCSYGQYPPSSDVCELDCFNRHCDILRKMDVIHDFSNTKRITQILNEEGFLNTCQTLLGGPWRQAIPPRNLIVWTESHRNRVLRGATDYEGTKNPAIGGNPGYPVIDAHVVNGGIETSFYTPDKNVKKSPFFLWMNRWHEAKGYKEAIYLAMELGFSLVLAGEHPDNELFDHQRRCALEAQMMISNSPNIKIQWLPKDPDHHTAKRHLYRTATALLYTNQFCEPFGLSMVEALSCQTPVIANDLGSPSEIIKQGLTGYICNNKEAWFRAIEDVLQNKIDNNRCRIDATSRFDKRVFAKNCLIEYEKIIKGESW